MDDKASLSLREIKKFDFIDALRGWALLAVMMGHVEQRMFSHPHVLSGVAKYGGYGVQLFFVVSAFTLFFSFFSREGFKEKTVRAFLIRRLFRIVPMFWIAILFYLGMNGFRHLYGEPQEITAWRILATVFFIHGWSPLTANNVVPGGWTIAIEMNFYLLLPFLYQKIKSLNKALLFFFATLAFSILANVLCGKWLMATKIPITQTEPFLYFWLPHQRPIFSLGFILFFLLRERLSRTGSCPDPGTKKTETLTAWTLIALSAVCFFSGWCLRGGGDFNYPQIPVGIGFLCVAWALAIYPLPFFVNRFTCYVGKISYSGYLCHFLSRTWRYRPLWRFRDITLFPGTWMRFSLLFSLQPLRGPCSWRP